MAAKNIQTEPYSIHISIAIKASWQCSEFGKLLTKLIDKRYYVVMTYSKYCKNKLTVIQATNTYN